MKKDIDQRMLSSPGAVTAPAETNELAAIETLLQDYNRSDAPGLVIGIARHGKPLYRRALGMASLEQGVANTLHTRMRIASTSKHFTALAIMLLAEEGRLSIDDAIRQHLPELPQLAASGPTLRQLLSHTSGWRGHDELSSVAHGLTLQPATQAMPAMARQSELNFEPGSQMIYSNGAYHMLAKIVERISGQGFAQFLTERILAPLGMLDTESVASDLEIHPRLAGLYWKSSLDGGYRRGVYPCELEGGGSMISTVDDMLRWLAHLRDPDKRVGSAASWAQMLAPTTLSSGTVLPYGFGLMRHLYRGVEVIHHSGAVIGGSSQMLTVPEHGLDIIIIANGATVSPVARAYQVIDALLADELPEPPEERAPLTAFPALLGQRYHAAATGHVIGFADVAGKLGLSWLNYTAAPLRQREGALWLSTLDLAISPLEIDVSEIDPELAPDTIALREGGQLRHFTRLPDTAPSAAVLAPQLCGDYRAPDLDATASITLQGERLALSVQGKHGSNLLYLQALSDDVMAVTSADSLLSALGGGGILNIERRAGRVVGLRLDSLRTRHLHLLRAEVVA
ncbi:serine hydrolase domain-containing protein [Undibacterium sp.]|uniref:serine hydrolase domain-containing protein n=1 Tax=Undibacterium sp. TaxID=1914977 RepID=UPI002B70F0F5|nr:serine hydrolase domain-containing protein [Undibacterium sp.]HTD07049.1 serine hydrolase domain-containing protein [Undibacterium sp.]